MASYRSTGIYVDTVPPPGANVVNGMWLYKVKRPPRSPPVFKARYVVRGFSQREGVDFFQTFAPTPKMTTLRVLLHIAAWRDYELHSLDFSTAFLQGSLHEQIWLRCPPGFTSSFPPTTQWQLRRLIYGLRQAPRVWHDTLRTTLAVLDFFPLSADPSLFVRRCSTPFFVLVYVDDLVFATPDRCALAFVKEELQRRHTCTSLGELQRYLGLHITKDSAACTITLTQSHMVEQILTRFHFPFSKVQLTLLAVDHGLTAPVSDESFESSGPYPELPLGAISTMAGPKERGGRGAGGRAEAEEEADLAETTSVEAAGVVDMAATTRATDAVAADSTASATIVTRADICGAIATSSLMDGLLLKAKRVEKQEEGEEEAVEAVAVAEVVLQV
ncbi:unnamed protein product [Closterium sp. NIES-54]